MKQHIVVIGGGLAGSAAAHSLKNRGYRVTVIEQRDRIGGRVYGKIVDGAAIELGAGFMTKDYRNMINFLDSKGLDHKLQRQRSKTGIYRNNKVHMLSVPTLLGNKVLSWRAKLYGLTFLMRILLNWRKLNLDAFWKAAELDTKSTSDIFFGKGGKEFIEYVLQPPLNGYFFWTPEQTSQAMTYILGKEVFSHKTFRLEGGLSQIPRLATAGCEVLLSHTVKTVQREQSGVFNIAVEHAKRVKTIKADGIVCATTADKVSGMFRDLNKRQCMFFDGIRYSSAALLEQVYKQSDTSQPKAIVFPRAEDTNLSSITLSKAPTTQQQQQLMALKIYASGTVATPYGKLTDDTLSHTLIEDMKPVSVELLSADARPVATIIQRWDEALPMFDVGHFRRLEEFHRGVIEDAECPLVFAGDYLGGPFMEGAFTSGLEGADRLHMRLHKTLPNK